MTTRKHMTFPGFFLRCLKFVGHDDIVEYKPASSPG